MEVLFVQRGKGEEVAKNRFQGGVTICSDRNSSATPSTTPDAPTKPDREAPPDESPVAPPSPWAPATKPHKCPRPGKEDLDFCVYDYVSRGVRRAD
jgi:hypothetical protein